MSKFFKNFTQYYLNTSLSFFPCSLSVHCGFGFASGLFVFFVFFLCSRKCMLHCAVNYYAQNGSTPPKWHQVSTKEINCCFSCSFQEESKQLLKCLLTLSEAGNMLLVCSCSCSFYILQKTHFCTKRNFNRKHLVHLLLV